MRTMFKKLLAVMLAVVLIVGVVPVTAIPEAEWNAEQMQLENETRNVNADAYDGVAWKLNQLKDYFAPGLYWNHLVTNTYDQIYYTGLWTWDYADCLTNTRCNSHDTAIVPVGWYDCNCFDGAAQCYGFANRILYGVFGQLCSQLTRRIDKENIKPGDHVRFNAWDGGHSAIVWSRNGDYITLYECNASEPEYCKIRLDRTVNIYDSNIVGFYQATNWDEVNQSHSTSCYIDVNARLDGNPAQTLQNYGTVDVYINGSKVADDVTNYYEQWPSGTTYEIKDIKPCTGHSYDGVYSGNRAGTLNATTTVVFSFSTNDYTAITESPERVPFNGHTYLYYSTPSSWYFAKEFCESQDGHLVCVTSEAENNFIKTLFTEGTLVWIGGTDYGTPNNWRWITGESFQFSSWNTGEPNENPSNNASSEDYIHYTTNGNWNDAAGCEKRAFVLEIDHLDHIHNIVYVPPVSPTCTEPGHTGYYYCAGCGGCWSDPQGQNEIDVSETVLPPLGHNMAEEAIAPTCIQPRGTRHFCTRCGYSYNEYPEENYSAWSTVYPSGVDPSLIETRQEYRYRDYETTSSTQSSMPGWVQTGSSWVQQSTGSVNYVASWPSGFDHSHYLYNTYNNTPLTAYETATEKLEITSNTTVGYIYWHWCRGELWDGPFNRLIEEYYTDEFCCFHAFYSTTSPADLYDIGGGVYQFPNGDCCLDSYWYFAVPVKRQNWVSYQKIYTYARWSDWSQWSPEPVEESDTREVQTRTVYRYVNAGFGDHVWDNGVVTLEPTYEHDGVMTYTCLLCGETRTEVIPALSPGHIPGDASGDGEVNVTDALLVLRAAMGLIQLSGVHFTAGDVNGNGVIDVSDALLILRYAMGLISTL